MAKDTFRTTKGKDGAVTAVRKGSKYDGGKSTVDEAVGMGLKTSVSRSKSMGFKDTGPETKGIQKFVKDAKAKK